MAESGSSLSKIMTDLFLKERSVLHVLKKTEHLRRLRKRLKKDIKKISPLLAPLMPKWSEDFEHSFISVNLFITEINLLLRINNPVITERAKKFWTDFWESSDDEEKEEFESACGDFSGEEEERNEETNWESILSLLKKLVNAVTELKGAALEDGELEEILRDLKNLPELEDVVDNIPEDLLVGVGEASIHERKLVNAFTELKGAALEDGELEEIVRDLKNLPELEDDVDNIPEDLLVGVGEASIHERKLVNAVTELKGAALEDGELEEIVRDLKNLPELEDVVDNIPEDLLVGVGEASIHER